MSRHFRPNFRPQRQTPPHEPLAPNSYHIKKLNESEAKDSEKSSLDLTQRFERKLAEYSASDNVFKRWILEITCWTVSALCMGAIAGIYVRINGKDMLSSETLISWINVLGKVAAAALIVPTSEALGQLKWNWFNKSRIMWDFEIFDKASRGPWGAVMLLFRTRGRSLAAFGALLIVLLLAIDTFFQQVVSYPDRWHMINLTGELPLVVRYTEPTPSEWYRHELQGGTNRNLAPILREFFYGNGTQPVPFGTGNRPDIPLSCPSSNCTWPEYNTLGVCSRCEEVSAALEITKTCMVTSIDWSSDWTGSLGPWMEMPYPNATVCGHFLNATSMNPILLAGYVISDDVHNATEEVLLMRTIPLTDFETKLPYYGVGSVAFKTVRNPLLDALITSSSDGSKESVLSGKAPSVHECILSWCVKTIQSSYDRGNYYESVVTEFWNKSSGPRIWPWTAFEVETGTFISYLDDIMIQPPRTNSRPNVTDSIYTAGNDTVYGVTAVFDDFFPASYTIQKEQFQPLLRFKNYYAGPSTKALEFNPWLAPNDISRHMERLATSMTNVIRSSGDKEMLNGHAYITETFVLVQWPWLIFPFALLLLSLAFLVATIVKTSKDTSTGIWKTSAMPTLIYGLPEDTRGKFAPQTSWNSSNGDAKKVRIKLMPNLGWRVSGQSLLRSPLLPTRSQPPPGWI